MHITIHILYNQKYEYLSMIKFFKKIKKTKKIFFITFLYILILFLIFYFLQTTKKLRHTKKNYTFPNNQTHIHHSDDVVINIYTSKNNFKYKFTATHIQHYPNDKITTFTQPNITIFNEKNIIIWTISCAQAKLNSNKILYLTGYVNINRITNNTYGQSIITKQLYIDLINQYIVSNSITIIHGRYFYSIGSKMHTNLQKQTIKLFTKIYTHYEI